MGKRPGRIRVRPRLLALVYGAGLAMIVLSSAELTILGSEHVIAGATRSTSAADAAILQGELSSTLPVSELGAPLSAPRRAALGSALATMAQRYGFLDVAVVGPDREVLASGGSVAASPAPDEMFLAALDGVGGTRIGSAANDVGPRNVLTEVFPFVLDGRVIAIAVVHRDAAPILADASAAWQDLVLVIAAAAVALAALLFVIFRAANARLMRQEVRLVEATRHDPLTGLINHGTGVATLTRLIAEVGERETLISIALVDIDNFRLLNSVHGEDAGDTALCTVARLLEEEGTGWLPVARFGPDEFLIVALDAAAQHLVASLQDVRKRIDGLTFRFGESELLPLTVSVGVANFPFHASAVTELLSAATIALGDAKASGGAELRVTGAWQRDGSGGRHSSFDVLQGLVLATDGKDRYTRRHSEDVARYAAFLAERLSLPAETQAAIHTAGLLHDIGKIGIPDEILRKPGPLTAREYDIVKQHVALGELIVRDLPDIEVVRAGIRHHHERWDGTGYLDRLAGEQIPLVARILAVADAFSAMTTSRPYRQALPVDEAIGRLLEAAGTQLEERLVRAFVQGLELVPDAPLPRDSAIVARRARGAA